jgi:hypothetical protein
MVRLTMPPLTDGVAPEVLVPRPNKMGIALHPDGLVPRIVIRPEYAPLLLDRLAREAASTPDHPVADLFKEVRACTTAVPPDEHMVDTSLFVPLRVLALGRELSFFSKIATFGTARHITIAELSIESFFPADNATNVALHAALA